MIYFITGDPYLVQQKRAKIIADITAEHSDIDVVQYDAASDDAVAQKVQAHVQSIGLFSTKKIVYIDVFSRSKQLLEGLDQIIDSVDDDTYLVLVDAAPDKRLAVIKKLMKDPRVTSLRCSIADYTVWIMQQAEAKGASISRGDAQYLLQRVGEQAALLDHEVHKLALFDTHITKKSIDMLTAPTLQSSVFDLVQAICSRNTKRALALYDEQRLLGNEPQAIIALVVWQLHIVALAVYAKGDIRTVAQKSGVKEFSLQKAVSIARQFDEQHLKKTVSALAALDIRSKSISINIDEAVRNFIVSV